MKTCSPARGQASLPLCPLTRNPRIVTFHIALAEQAAATHGVQSPKQAPKTLTVLSIAQFHVSRCNPRQRGVPKTGETTATAITATASKTAVRFIVLVQRVVALGNNNLGNLWCFWKAGTKK